MKLNFILLFIMLLGSLNFAKAQEETFLRFSLGANFMTPIHESESYKFFSYGTNNYFPTIRAETFPVMLETDKFDFYLSMGTSYSSYGYKYELNTDTVFAMKASGPTFFGGIGATAYLIEDIPISLLIDYSYMIWGKQKNYINDKHTVGFWSNPQFNDSQHILTGRIDVRVLDDSFRLSLFYQTDWYFIVNGLSNDPNGYLTHSIGISFSFINGFYTPIYL